MAGSTSIVDATVDFVTGTFDAQDVRLATIGPIIPGLAVRGDFTVTQNGGGAMNVNISSGRVFVDPGGPGAMQGAYLASSKVSYNTNTDGGYTWAAADPTNARIDLLCIEVADTDQGGSFTGYKFRVVDGTPNASATHPLETAYWPSVPNYVVPIAAIRIRNAATTILTADIQNLNAIGGVGRTAYTTTAGAETTTSATYARLATPDFVCVYVPHTSARVRLAYSALSKISVASGTQGVAIFVNGTQLKYRTVANGAPIAAESTVTSLSTFLGPVGSGPGNSTPQGYPLMSAGATADISEVSTGMILSAGSTQPVTPFEIYGLTAGWYIIEAKWKTSANTLTAQNRRMVAEVLA